MAIKNYYIGKVSIFDGNKKDAMDEAKRKYGNPTYGAKYNHVITKVVPWMGSTHVYEVFGHLRGSKVRE